MTKLDLEGMSENMNKIGQSTYNAAKSFYAMNTDALGQLFDQQVAMATLGMESVTRQMELIANAKDYKAVIEGQTDIANDFSSKSQGIARNTLDILDESKEEVCAWVEKATEEVADYNPIIKAA